jgi:tetratricopeptide (TPR) repeat protein
MLQNSGRNGEAANAFERAATAKPGFGEALLNLGHALKALGQDEKAQEYWREAIESMPELAGSYFGAGK